METIATTVVIAVVVVLMATIRYRRCCRCFRCRCCCRCRCRRFVVVAPSQHVLRLFNFLSPSVFKCWNVLYYNSAFNAFFLGQSLPRIRFDRTRVPAVQCYRSSFCRYHHPSVSNFFISQPNKQISTQSANRPPNQPTNQPVNKSIKESLTHSITQSLNQSINPSPSGNSYC